MDNVSSVLTPEEVLAALNDLDLTPKSVSAANTKAFGINTFIVIYPKDSKGYSLTGTAFNIIGANVAVTYIDNLYSGTEVEGQRSVILKVEKTS